jgi:hypothetical protein
MEGENLPKAMPASAKHARPCLREDGTPGKLAKRKRRERRRKRKQEAEVEVELVWC